MGNELWPRRFFTKPPPAVGLTVSSTTAVVVSVRADPLCVTGVYRQSLIALPDHVDRQDDVLRSALTQARSLLRLPTGTAIHIACEPVHDEVWVQLNRVPMAEVPVTMCPRLPQTLAAAGFGTPTFDLVPAALARFALTSGGDRAGLWHRSGWTVAVNGDALKASWQRPNGTTEPADVLPSVDSTAERGLRVPRALRGRFNVDTDAIAAGAALGGLGRRPHVQPAAGVRRDAPEESPRVSAPPVDLDATTVGSGRRPRLYVPQQAL